VRSARPEALGQSAIFQAISNGSPSNERGPRPPRGNATRAQLVVGAGHQAPRPAARSPRPGERPTGHGRRCREDSNGCVPMCHMLAAGRRCLSRPRPASTPRRQSRRSAILDNLRNFSQFHRVRHGMSAEARRLAATQHVCSCSPAQAPWLRSPRRIPERSRRLCGQRSAEFKGDIGLELLGRSDGAQDLSAVSGGTTYAICRMDASQKPCVRRADLFHRTRADEITEDPAPNEIARCLLATRTRTRTIRPMSRTGLANLLGVLIPLVGLCCRPSRASKPTDEASALGVQSAEPSPSAPPQPRPSLPPRPTGACSRHS
jgi:hypothetical protein